MFSLHHRPKNDSSFRHAWHERNRTTLESTEYFKTFAVFHALNVNIYLTYELLSNIGGGLFARPTMQRRPLNGHTPAIRRPLLYRTMSISHAWMDGHLFNYS